MYSYLMQFRTQYLSVQIRKAASTSQNDFFIFSGLCSVPRCLLALPLLFPASLLRVLPQRARSPPLSACLRLHIPTSSISTGTLRTTTTIHHSTSLRRITVKSTQFWASTPKTTNNRESSSSPTTKAVF